MVKCFKDAIAITFVATGLSIVGVNMLVPPAVEELEMVLDINQPASTMINLKMPICSCRLPPLSGSASAMAEYWKADAKLR